MSSMKTEANTNRWIRKCTTQGRSNACGECPDVVSQRPRIISTSTRWGHARREWLIRKVGKWSKRAQCLVAQMSLVSVVFLANICLTSYANARYPTPGAVGLVHEGGCGEVNALNSWLHVLISVLSMLMLSASNYCMQLQVSPTRAQVDEAHREGKSLDIGLHTLRNMRYIGGWRRISWAILALTSLPINVLQVHSHRPSSQVASGTAPSNRTQVQLGGVSVARIFRLHGGCRKEFLPGGGAVLY